MCWSCKRGRMPGGHATQGRTTNNQQRQIATVDNNQTLPRRLRQWHCRNTQTSSCFCALCSPIYESAHALLISLSMCPNQHDSARSGSFVAITGENSSQSPATRLPYSLYNSHSRPQVPWGMICSRPRTSIMETYGNN